MINSMCNDPWLVLRTRSRQENVVQDFLRQKDIRLFLPKRYEVRRWQDRTKLLEAVLFPGYVFVQPRLEQVSILRYVRGSCGLLMCGDKLATISQRDLDAIKIMVHSGEPLDVVPELVCGQRVEVIAGPFLHAQGEFVRMKSQHRLVINAHLIGKSISVEIDAAHVRPIGDNEARDQASREMRSRVNGATAYLVDGGM